MNFDSSSLPVSGGVVLAGLFYAGVSVFALGPLVAERTIEKSNWPAQCQQNLTADIELERTPPKVIPRMDCKSMLGSFMPQLSDLCTHYGNPDFGGMATQVIRQQEQARKHIEDQRLSRAAAQTGSRCACAASIVARDYDWAIHAGSMRLIKPTSVKNLSSELKQAVHSPHCSAR